jgi:hypothetical protein
LSKTDDELSVNLHLTGHHFLALGNGNEQQANDAQLAATTSDHGFAAPVSSVEELVDRYARARVWDNECEDFNPDTFEKDAESHIKNFGIDKLGAIVGIQGNETRQVVVKNVALFTEVHFVRDPFTLKTISVSTEDMKQDMVRRGFDAIMVDHITDPMALPMAPDAPTASARKDLGEIPREHS